MWNDYRRWTIVGRKTTPPDSIQHFQYEFNMKRKKKISNLHITEKKEQKNFFVISFTQQLTMHSRDLKAVELESGMDGCVHINSKRKDIKDEN